jgi:hypothetical protein
LLLDTSYALFRLLLLSLAAASGFVAVYIPLMYLLFDKRIGFIYFPIVGISIYVAYQVTKHADKYLPRIKYQSGWYSSAEQGVK